ncbi:hypothetical protein J2755_000513 [Methanohalophilus levihalophilus]|uniref:DUF7502 family protein n=1 Tax=Methanohalophilus levihalophilus TaxID=1431282 RepID=UPI001AE719E0|nr:hypothetical protein [Methanohalophilus levihalophilus]MBP2029593.1 hypothetical protein [Methanohalophilus levihalophilus]
MEMSAELEQFLQSKQHAVSKYRRLLLIGDVIALTLLLFSFLLYFNMDQIFFVFSSLESFADTSYPVGSFDIGLTTIVLLCFSFLLSSIVTFFWSRRSNKQIIVKTIEDKCPPLKERLRTAYDNRELTNVIAVDLLKSVVKSTETVTNSILLDRKQLKITVVFLLVSILLASGALFTDFRSEITPPDIQETLEDLPFLPNGEEITPETSPLDDGNGPSGETIIGDPSVIIVEGEEVDLTLPPGSEQGFGDAGEDDSLPPDFKPSSSYDVGRMSSSAYYEDLPEGYEDIIKSYFEEITKQ